MTEKEYNLSGHFLLTLYETLAAVVIAHGYCYRQHNTLPVLLQKIPDTDKVSPHCPEQESLNSALHMQKLWLTGEKKFPLNQPLVEVKTSHVVTLQQNHSTLSKILLIFSASLTVFVYFSFN